MSKREFSKDMSKEQFFEYIGGINRYMLLSRMKSDCRYYLGYGNRYAPDLWAQNPVSHIRYMKWLWQSFADDAKPEWLTWEQIEEYERRMPPEEARY